jgi:hypothetical protein
LRIGGGGEGDGGGRDLKGKKGGSVNLGGGGDLRIVRGVYRKFLFLCN